ncbi:response regulator transcription factor [Exiguobacterium profundum]|uniref:Two component transcriptional regulator, winged helix family n=2 Tax=Bacilli TaxID=91061 RepID=C4KYT6_EXISA|nr:MULTISPECIES: response regulator transcription factor [Exiguobacterium]QPI68117.1 response regulator transcription factor [Exiguobacterium sp. PBE]ACQ70249.1 two component transcriptional regulator, winged helix family [Exiguobacterium sp. AT1b]MBG0918046.1 response regulator transcription factor [Exiguobacterium sp. SRB7LM]MCT4798114.1 response regulator transcription factor [Exiguobacterium profundum]MDT0192587.1 response regulator transcription factor [Exiguobacterium sp. BG5(2022)]
MQTILVVEDDSKIARLLELELKHAGYAVMVATDGRTGLERALADDVDLVLLDVMLPQMSGLEVVRRLKEERPLLPVLMVTARGDRYDKVSGLDLGADDYITKPFEIEEVLARIRAFLRMRQLVRQDHSEQVLTYETLTVDVNRHEVYCDGKKVDLTRREFDLLVFFLENPERVLTRDQLVEHVWGFDYYGDTNVVDVYVRYVRKKLTGSWIQTVRGVGYMLKRGE